MQIGRCQLHGIVQQVQQIVRHNSFHYVFIPETQPYPQAIQLRPAQEHLPLRLKSVRKLPDEIYGLNGGHRN